MPLASLYTLPETREDWNNWSFANADSHLRIIQAIQAQQNTPLPYYSVDPIPWESMSDWLRNHQQMHNDMDAQLNIESSDYTVPDFRDRASMLAFILAHADEHRDAEGRLGLT